MNRRAGLFAALLAVLLTAACGAGTTSGTPVAAPVTGSSGSSSSTSGPSTSGPSTSGPSTSGPSASGSASASPKGDFTLVVPTGWSSSSALASTPQVDGVYLGPQHDVFRTNLNVIRTDAVAGADLAQYRASALAQIRARLTLSDVSPSMPTTVDGDPAVEYTLVDTQEGQLLKQRQTLVVHGGSAYAFTFTARTVDFAGDSAAGEGIVASVRWRS